MRLLVLEPFDSGSHRAFLDGWLQRTRHQPTRLSLPGRFWKWRMRHAAVTFADWIAQRQEAGEQWDVLWCSSMLNLAELRGLLPNVTRLPTILYFHENQLAYPYRRDETRDRHFTLINLTSALAAEAVWFNSAHNRDSFLDHVPRFLKDMPTRHLRDVPQRIRPKTAIHPPGIDPIEPKPPQPGPLRILWAGRWEHDKNPKTFFYALDRLARRAVPFRLSVVGEQFRRRPEVFDWAGDRFAGFIDHWGYQADATDYAEVLRQSDVIVSTTRHEFFGLAVMEAASAGCLPILPRRLVYPELFDEPGFFYDGSVQDLTNRLMELARAKDEGTFWSADRERAMQLARQYAWDHIAPRLDTAVEQVIANS